MPGTRRTQGNNGPIPKPWNDLAAAISNNATLSQATAVQGSTITLDPYQNACRLTGNLNQIVTIGAGWITGSPVQGVAVGTGLTNYGEAYPSGFAHSLITTTKGSTAATLTGGTSGFTNGYQIGATIYETPPTSDATAPPNYIAPGTTYTISGANVTLSSAALLTGSGLYCCTVLWNLPGSSNAFTNVHP